MIDALAQIILDLLNYLHGYIPSYGWNIIVLTVLVRAVMFPLTFSGLKGMKAMQLAQPRIKEIQAKYKDDKEKLNREMMALYKEIGFNPLSSCLPMLLQLPIFFALYRVLSLPEMNGFILVNQDFYGMNLTSSAITKLSPDFLKDLSIVMPGTVDLGAFGISFLKDYYLYTPVLIVVALMNVTTILQQKMMTIDPQQKTQMWMMNVILVYFSFIMPAGVLLYWGVSNMLQFAQQALIKNPVDPKTAARISKAASGEKEAKAKNQGAGADNIVNKDSSKASKKTAAGKETAGQGADEGSGGKSKPAKQGGGRKNIYPAQKSGAKKKRKKKK